MSRRIRVSLAAVLAAAALALTGCASDTDTDTNTTGQSVPSSAAYPVTVGKVTLDRRPARIVSLSPSGTEMLYAMGAGPQVTAVDELSNYPSNVPKSDLSGMKPNAEAIAGRNPDLVVVSDDVNKIVSQLARLKIPAYVASAATTLDDVYREIGDLGRLTGHPDEADDLVARMKDDIAKTAKDVKPRKKPLSYYYEISQTLYSATSKTFIGSLLSLLRLDNIADAARASGAATGYPRLSAEAIVKANPDLIFLADTKCCQQSVATVVSRPGWANVTAVRNNQVVALDDDVASRWGPRVVDLLRAVAAVVSKVPAE